MTFTDDQQQEHRDAFIHECRQKAWGAACHADWVSKGIDKVYAEYQKQETEDRALQEQIKGLETAIDSQTKDNREKRKALQERRNQLAKAMEALGRNVQQGHQALMNLHQSVETNLELAKHAEGWEWKEGGNIQRESH